MNVVRYVALGLVLIPALAQARTLSELTAAMEQPGAVSYPRHPDGGQAGVSFSPEFMAAKKELLQGIRDRTFSTKDYGAIVAMYRALPREDVVIDNLPCSSCGADFGIGPALVDALPDEPAVLAFLTELSKGEPEPVIHGLLKTLSRLKSTHDPKAVPVLLAYLRNRRSFKDTPKVHWPKLDEAFEILKANFASSPEFIDFLWEPFVDQTGERNQAEPILLGYRGPNWIEKVERAASSQDPWSRSTAKKIIVSSEEPALQSALISVLEHEALAVDDDYSRAATPVKQLAAMAPKDRHAFAALLRLAMTDTEASDPASRSLVALAEPSPLPALEPNELEPVFAWLTQVRCTKRVMSNCSSNTVQLGGQLDLSPLIARLLPFLDDAKQGEKFAVILGSQRSDAVIKRVLSNLNKCRPEIQLKVLETIQERPSKERPWESELLPLLSSTDSEVLAATIHLLESSQSPAIRARLKKIPDDTLLRVADSYLAVTDGLVVRWSISRPSVTLGQHTVAQVTIENKGIFPFKVPLEVDGHHARWQIVEDREALGPLELTPEKSGEQVVKRGGKVSLSFPLDDVLGALGPGSHSLVLQYFSRSNMRHWPSRPDFHRETDPLTVTILLGQDRAVWAASTGGIQADIESADLTRRAEGWQRFAASWKPAPLSEFAQKLEGQFSKGTPPEAKLQINFVVYDQEIHQESYVVTNDKAVFSWSEEDIRGSVTLPLEPKEVVEFVRLLAEGLPGDHPEIQHLGGAYDPQLQRLGVSLGTDQKIFGGPWWVAELSNHPASRAWWERLQSWKKRAHEQKR
jgi:hypothetical protein